MSPYRIHIQQSLNGKVGLYRYFLQGSQFSQTQLLLNTRSAVLDQRGFRKLFRLAELDRFEILGDSYQQRVDLLDCFKCTGYLITVQVFVEKQDPDLQIFPHQENQQDIPMIPNENATLDCQENWIKRKIFLPRSRKVVIRFKTQVYFDTESIDYEEIFDTENFDRYFQSFFEGK